MWSWNQTTEVLQGTVLLNFMTLSRLGITIIWILCVPPKLHALKDWSSGQSYQEVVEPLRSRALWVVLRSLQVWPLGLCNSKIFLTAFCFLVRWVVLLCNTLCSHHDVLSHHRPKSVRPTRTSKIVTQHFSLHKLINWEISLYWQKANIGTFITEQCFQFINVFIST